MNSLPCEKLYQLTMMNKVERIDRERNLKLKHPATVLVSGATGSGKTTLVKRLLDNADQMFAPSIEQPIKVVWVYGASQNFQPSTNQNVCIEYTEQLPEAYEDIDILVLDDLQNSLSGSKKLGDIYTKYSHHKQMTVIYIVQNIFNSGAQMRNISLNSHYIILSKNRRDLQQVKVLGIQLYGEASFFSDAYKKAVLDRDFGYLMIDLTPTTEEKFRLRTQIFPGESTLIYTPKNA